jgi:mono/diheme cytochrome c family protein
MTNKHLVFLALVLLLAVACGPQPLPAAPTPIPTLAPATLPAVTPTQPASTEATPTGAGTQDQVAAGQQIFDQNCSVCHNLTTERKVGPGLAGLFGISQLPDGKPFNQANLEDWIRTGGRGMPGFPLSDQQMAELIAYLQQATKQ